MRALTLTTRKTNTILGLEIEAGSVAAAEVRVNGRAELVGHGILPLEPGVFREGEVGDVDRLAEALKELVARNKLGKDVRLGIANQRVAVRVLHLPVIEDRKELDTAVRFQAQDQIPMPFDQATIDWQVIPPADGAESPQGLDVVVVAARTEMVERATEAMRQAGLRPVGIDHSAFGLIRALAPSPQPDAAAGLANAGTTLHCNLGDLTNLAVAHGSACLFTRVATFGVEGIAQRLAERRDLTVDWARRWLVHVGLEANVATITGEPEIVAAAREVLSEGASRLADELRLSLDYYAAQDGALPIASILASGPGTAIPGLVGQLESLVGRPLTVARPAALDGLDPVSAARLTVPFGMALES